MFASTFFILRLTSAWFVLYLVFAIFAHEVFFRRSHSEGVLVAIGAMLGCFWKRHNHPWNVALLGLFTLAEAVTVGAVVSYYNQTVVLQALVITVYVPAARHSVLAMQRRLTRGRGCVVSR